MTLTNIPTAAREPLQFERYTVKELRERATKMKRKWPVYASANNINAATVNREQLETFYNSVFFTNDYFHKFMAATADESSKEATDALDLTDTFHTMTPTASGTETKAETKANGKANAQALADLLAEMMNRPQTVQIDESKVREIVAKAMEGYSKVQITINDVKTQTTHELKGLFHKTFPRLLKAAAIIQPSGLRHNIWMTGPTGSGKTTAAEQVAEALGLRYGFHGSMLMAHELTGFVDGHGQYHKTQFVDLFEHGGVCLLDEVDGGDNPALLALQAALANGNMSLPDGRIIKRHPDFICIAAANTVGLGATAEYVGRIKLDAAFLNRFTLSFHWDYDEALERQLAGNDDWTSEVQAARAKAAALGLKVNITPRHSIAGASALAAGFPIEEVRAMTYCALLTPDQRKMIRG